MFEVVVVMPTYNEVENVKEIIPILIDVLKKAGWRASVLVVDDSSPDGTAEVVEELSKKFEGVKLLKRPGKLGLGSAYIDGFNYINREMGYVEFVCEMDADFSHPPEILPHMLDLAKRGGYDVIIASRYIEGGRWEEKSIIRRLISRGANLLARISTGVKARDLTSGYRVIRLDILKKIIEKLTELHSGYVFQVELLYLLYKEGAKIGEYPLVFKPRVYGRSKLGKKEIISFASWCLKNILRRISS
ncbi:MAG: polyprenol monophosphomannose synthase [Aigarchaeota archaeon]|nr:polyprenol monophosphomannose synthase [Aigarchaeota archaeon]MCX8192690.1 polyprenol monophosphomannose synthase [Nitrososphaeria archaeon]MDW7987010.1 polyprenol monophosphomannose synthase [Nitrososphaerota archaeon]